jgi:hypothetical protein
MYQPWPSGGQPAEPERALCSAPVLPGIGSG